MSRVGINVGEGAAAPPNFPLDLPLDNRNCEIKDGWGVGGRIIVGNVVDIIAQNERSIE